MLLTFGMVSIPYAQDVQSEESEADIYNMQAFVINTDADSGYIAVDSLAGGRINTPYQIYSFGHFFHDGDFHGRPWHPECARSFEMDPQRHCR